VPIWDLHCHLSGVPGVLPEQRAERLLNLANLMGIERLCVYMGLRFQPDPDPEAMRNDNNAVLRAIAAFPDQILGFVYLNPKHPEASLAEVERCVADGPMVGIKLWIAQRCSTSQLDPIIERAAELQALVFQHTWFKTGGNQPGESTPLDLATLARRHPSVPLICGHTGGDWERGLRAIRELPNTFADLAGSDPCAGFTEMAVRELGAARVLYGSDAGGRSFASQLGKVYGAAIPQPDKQRILSGNLRALLNPILTRKGMKP
jgi:predicted TIM-barrel fold metal-dependent hydrolase